jgi:hypothetical protein
LIVVSPCTVVVAVKTIKQRYSGQSTLNSRRLVF